MLLLTIFKTEIAVAYVLKGVVVLLDKCFILVILLKIYNCRMTTNLTKTHRHSSYLLPPIIAYGCSFAGMSYRHAQIRVMQQDTSITNPEPPLLGLMEIRIVG